VVDGQTLEDDTVTVRDRDSRAQTRMPISALRAYIGERVSFRTVFEKL
jgi:glycyl-tRNA synthetase